MRVMEPHMPLRISFRVRELVHNLAKGGEGLSEPVKSLFEMRAIIFFVLTQQVHLEVTYFNTF